MAAGCCSVLRALCTRAARVQLPSSLPASLPSGHPPYPPYPPTAPLTCPSVQAASAKREVSALQAELLEAASEAEAVGQERDELLAAMEARHDNLPLGGEGGGDAAAQPPSASAAKDEQLARLEAAIAQHAEELHEANSRAEALERERDELRDELLAAGLEAAPWSSRPSRDSGVVGAAEDGVEAAAPQDSPAAAGAAAGVEGEAAKGEAAKGEAAKGGGEGEPPSTPPKKEKKEKKAAPLTPSAPPSTMLRVPYPVLGADTALLCGEPPADSAPRAEHALLVLGGGGGASKTGIPNRLLLCSLPPTGIEVYGEQDTGTEAVTGVALAMTAAATKLACVQGDEVVIYDVHVPGPLADPQAAPPSLFVHPKRLSVMPPGGAAKRDAANPDEVPKEERPYCVSLDGRGERLVVGMEDGSVLLFDAVQGGAGWTLRWREKKHTKEVKSCCFSAAGDMLCTVAPDGQCLIWPLGGGGALTEPPTALAQPPFTMHKMFASEKQARKKAHWRCVRLRGASGGGAPSLFAAINHQGGPGWVVRASLAPARVEQCAKAGSSPVTALDVSADGSLVAAGTSEGELIVMQAASLQRLLRVQPHDIFITNLCFSSQAGVLTCAGDNSNVFTPLSPEKLKPDSYWLSMLIALVAVALALMGMMN